jgi:hypothetical protein
MRVRAEQALGPTFVLVRHRDGRGLVGIVRLEHVLRELTEDDALAEHFDRVGLADPAERVRAEARAVRDAIAAGDIPRVLAYIDAKAIAGDLSPSFSGGFVTSAAVTVWTPMGSVVPAMPRRTSRTRRPRRRVARRNRAPARPGADPPREPPLAASEAVAA